MRKRNLILGFIAVLIIVAGFWIIKRSLANKVAIQDTPNNLTSLYRTGTLVIPTVNVSTSTSNCDSKKFSASDLNTGAPGIKPHLCSIPTFTEQDVRDYMQKVRRFIGMRINQISPNYTLTRILFVTNQVANDPNGLNADTGISDPSRIICYVEVYGDFRVEGGPVRPAGATPIPPLTFHHGQMVFDGITGNLLSMGIMP
ncbi:MAG TPA: hypothetical protein VFN23_09935 [Ktedonobacteraceae bacterium]|nr:hypothetical protein [Ktedonobacteraceae bacterium]